MTTKASKDKKIFRICLEKKAIYKPNLNSIT